MPLFFIDCLLQSNAICINHQWNDWLHWMSLDLIELNYLRTLMLSTLTQKYSNIYIYLLCTYTRTLHTHTHTSMSIVHIYLLTYLLTHHACFVNSVFRKWIESVGSFELLHWNGTKMKSTLQIRYYLFLLICLLCHQINNKTELTLNEEINNVEITIKNHARLK